jgi:hypothetical protein
VGELEDLAAAVPPESVPSGQENANRRPVSQAAWDRFLALIRSGKSVTAASKDKQTPSEASVYRRLKDDKEFMLEYRSACDMRTFALVEQLQEIPTRKDLSPQMARVLSENIRWLLERVHSKQFGPTVKVTNEFEGVPDSELDKRVEMLRAQLASLERRGVTPSTAPGEATKH